MIRLRVSKWEHYSRFSSRLNIIPRILLRGPESGDVRADVAVVSHAQYHRQPLETGTGREMVLPQVPLPATTLLIQLALLTSQTAGA